ncbi:hypothetical protein [Howardella ureilytica]
MKGMKITFKILGIVGKIALIFVGILLAVFWFFAKITLFALRRD